MTDQHPITPPPELVAKWTGSTCGYYEAVRWGAANALPIPRGQPAAQAVLDAVEDHGKFVYRNLAAAALEAVADQVVPENVNTASR